MSQIQIQTTQNVALSFTPASVGDRIIAHLIDWVIFIGWFLIFILAAAGLSKTVTDGGIGSIIFFVCMLLPFMLYDLLMEVFMNGQTLGKRAMDIRVLTLNGTPPTLGAYLMRWMFRLVDTGIFGSVVALVVAAVNGKGQRLGDIAAGTAVVKLKQTVNLQQLRQEKIQEDYIPIFSEATLLSDRDVVTIRAVLKKGKDENNVELIWQAAQKVKEAISVSSDLNDTEFLNQILKDHTYVSTME